MQTIIGPSAIMPAGTFLTFWISTIGLPNPGQNSALLDIEEYPGSEVQTAPDYSLVQYRLRLPSPRPPAPRSIIPQPPAAVRITSLGFSRIIPWELLAPALKREYIVNLVNGQPTPGLMPV